MIQGGGEEPPEYSLGGGITFGGTEPIMPLFGDEPVYPVTAPPKGTIQNPECDSGDDMSAMPDPVYGDSGDYYPKLPPMPGDDTSDTGDYCP